MAEILKINSRRALVMIPENELIDNNLMKWIRTDSKGYGHRDFISIQPIESYATKIYHQAYPNESALLAERVYIEGKSVYAVLRTVSVKHHDDLYNHYHIPNKTVPYDVLKYKQAGIDIDGDNLNKDSIFSLLNSLDSLDDDIMEDIREFTKCDEQEPNNDRKVIKIKVVKEEISE